MPVSRATQETKGDVIMGMEIFLKVREMGKAVKEKRF
jgi:hypothetical protein